MSVLIARKQKDKITLVSDSQQTWGESSKQNVAFSKIRKIEDGVYIGFAGNAHVSSLLAAYLEQYTVLNIETSYDLIGYFKEFTSWSQDTIVVPPDSIDPTLTCEYLIIIKNKVFHFNNFYVRELNDGEVSAIGIGAQSALACMKLTDSIEDALTAVCETDIYCSLPLDIIEVDIKE